MTVSIIKLVNGTEIVGNVLDDDGNVVIINDPLQINYRQRNNSNLPSISLHRYNPFSNSTCSIFNGKDILSIDLPLPGMVKYYDVSIKYIREEVDKLISEELFDAASSHNEMSDETKIKMAMMEKQVYKPTLN